MKIPLVKEWGSWVVFVASCLAAIAAASSLPKGDADSGTRAVTAATIAGFFFLINTKPSLSAAIRAKGPKRIHILWFLVFMVSGLVLMAPFLRTGLERFAPFFILVLTYAAFMWSGKEHHIAAELNGFALLTASAPVVYFVMTGDMSIKLYTAVLLFFAAGVLKVRVRTRKTFFYRGVMVAYCALVPAVFLVMDIHLILLTPLLENMISALWMREEKLKTTGNIELVKSILFVILTGQFWV